MKIFKKFLVDLGVLQYKFPILVSEDKKRNELISMIKFISYTPKCLPTHIYTSLRRY